MRKALEIHPSERQQSNSCKTLVNKFEVLAGTATKEGAVVLCLEILEVSMGIQTREALSGLLSVYACT